MKIGTQVATLPGAWCRRVSAGTGWPGINILWLGDVESLICSFFLSVAAQLSEQIYPWDTPACCWGVKQPVSKQPSPVLLLLVSTSLLPPLSPFTFHLGFVHPLQDVTLNQCLPLPSVCCFPVPGGSLLVMSSCHCLLGRPLDLFPLLGCHSVQRLVHLLSFILAICLYFCFSVYSIMPIVFVLFLISETASLA